MSGQRRTQDYTRSAQKHFAQKKAHNSFAQEQEKVRVAQQEKTERLDLPPRAYLGEFLWHQ